MQNLIESLYDQLEDLAEKGLEEGLTKEEFHRYLELERAVENLDD